MPNRLRCALLVFVMSISAVLSAGILQAKPAAAQEQEVLQELPAVRIEQVQRVGRALLQAKRSYQPPEQTKQLRQDVKALHTLLETLTEPVEGDLQFQDKTKQTQSKTKANDLWREKRAGQIDWLLQTADRIAAHGKQLSQKKNSRKGAGAIVSSSSKPALNRLGQLRSELDQALALPAQERQTRLMQLKRQLKLGQASLIRQTDGPAESPTMTNRTQHRPMAR